MPGLLPEGQLGKKQMPQHYFYYRHDALSFV